MVPIRIRGFLFAILLFMSSLLGALFILVPFMPLIVLDHRLWRLCADRLVGYWLTFPAVNESINGGIVWVQSLCTYLLGIDFHVTGDVIDHQRPALIIMNHRTRLDWLFFWNALYKMNPWLLTTEKISLKKELRRVPGAGWAMGCGSYLFLDRRYESDRLSITQAVEYYSKCGFNYQGTDRSDVNLQRSNDFAVKNGMMPYEQLLHPRTVGFVHLYQLMKSAKYLDAVYNVTLGYADRIVSNEMELLLKGHYPQSVHFDIERIDVKDMPTDADQLTSWIQKVWAVKENRLQKFYSLPENQRRFDPSGEGFIWPWGLSIKNQRRFDPSGEGFIWPVKVEGAGYMIAFAFWLLTSAFWIYISIISSFVQFYILLSIAFYVVIDYRRSFDPEYFFCVTSIVLIMFLSIGHMRSAGEPAILLGGSALERLKGITYGALVLISAFLGSLYVLVPLLPLIFIFPRAWRLVIDHLVGAWLVMPTTIVEWLFKVDVKVYGDKIRSDEPALLLMNHRTRLDWLFFWNALLKIDYRLMFSEKISLKAILRFVPGAGWYGSMISKLTVLFLFHGNGGEFFSLLGSVDCGRSREIVRNGSLLCEKWEKLSEQYVCAVYDVTVAFTAGIVQSELAFITDGACPTQVHYHIRRIPVDQLPIGDSEVAAWLVDLWKQKESLLRDFYTGNRTAFVEPQFQTTTGIALWQIGSVIFWLGATACWMWILFSWPYQHLYLLFCVSLFVLCHVFGGLEWLVVAVFDRLVD